MTKKTVKIVIAPNAFKECLSAGEAASAIKKGVKKASPDADTIIIPLADGGDGMLSAFLSFKKGRIIKTRAFDPLMNSIPASYAVLEDGTAVIEMALVSGLNLIPPARRSAAAASSFGLGQLILHAAKKGCRKFIVGIGGSATTDGGAGMAQAAGYQFLTKEGKPVSPGGEGLAELAVIKDSPYSALLGKCSFHVVCDVGNTLLGKKGAAAVFAPQKGASQKEVKQLEFCLKNLADKVENQLCGKFRNIPGTGAAGGTGFMFKSLFQGRLVSGSELILQEADFSHKCKGADLIITAEGALDGQTALGKLIMEISKTGKKLNIPVIALSGNLGPGWKKLYQHGLTAAFAIAPGPISRQESIASAESLLSDSACNIVKLFCAA